jgi:hypothetical protein
VLEIDAGTHGECGLVVEQFRDAFGELNRRDFRVDCKTCGIDIGIVGPDFEESVVRGGVVHDKTFHRHEGG